jgi:methylmalonyl-CoA mutase C-terminal domain/subunit
MGRGRVVVGAVGDDDDVRAMARALRDSGREVVFAGGHQTAEQLVRTALAEDVAEIVVAADATFLAHVAAVQQELGAADIVVTLAGEAPGGEV